MSVAILDQFTDTSGTRLGSHTIAPTNVPGASWSERNSSNWQVNGSNQATLNSNGGVSFENVADCDAGVADTTWQVDLTASGTGTTLGGVYFNADASMNGWWLVLRSDTGTCEIYEFDAGNFASKASASYTVTGGTTYTLKAVTSGDNIDGYVNGSLVVSYNVGSRPYKANTKGGLCIYSAFAADLKWDNFQVGTSSPPPPPSDPIAKCVTVNQAVTAAVY